MARKGDSCLLKLKKVHLLGFKSFCDRTEIALDDKNARGLTAIVGPNGCGKSNISDALIWVLGEQSAKSMRGTKMEDVIFSGTRDRRSTGMAEVSLTFIDPDIYVQESPESEDAPDTTLRDNFTEAEAEDWDEAAVRARAAQETEEIIADLQPGQLLEEGQGPAAEGSDSAQDEDTANASGAPAVVLKVRRRKFQRTPTRRGEIVITRRLFRSGNSEYLLNGKLCRLRDIQDIFMGTGLGPDTYAIISQERVGQLLSSKPYERRSMIEEAAGTTRFKTKKRLAELRLEQAKQNLARVNDIFDEVTRQMNSLKRQAAKAERYAALRQEVQQRLRLVIATRLAEMGQEAANLESGLATLTAQVDALGGQVGALDQQHATATERGYALEGQAREAAARASAITVDIERALTQMQANEERSTELVARIRAEQAELEETRRHLAELDGERAQQKEFLDQAGQTVDAARQDVQALQTEQQRATDDLSRAEQGMEELRQKMLQWMTQVNHVRQQTMQGEAALEALQQEAGRLEMEREDLRRDLERMGAEREQLSQGHSNALASLQQVELELASLRSQLEARRQEEDVARRSVDQLRADRAAVLGRCRSLETMIQGHSYSTDTVRKLLRSKASEDTWAPIGVLADFLEVTGQHGPVIDEFLHEELNYVVVKSWDAAHAGVHMLKTDVEGRATFLVSTEGAASLSKENTGSGNTEVPQREGVVCLKDCVQFMNGVGRSLEDALPRLRDGYLAPNAETARALALEHPHAYFLAPSGECYHHTTVTGGRASAEGPLALKRDLREAQQNLTQREERLAAAEATLKELADAVTALTQQIDSRSTERRQIEQQAANAGAALRQMEAEMARLDRRLQESATLLERNQSAQQEKSAWLAQRREEAQRIEAGHASAEGQLANSQAALQGLRAAREEAQARLAEATAHLAGLEERRRGASAAVERLERMHAEMQQRVRQLEQQLAANEAERIQRVENAQRLEQRRVEMEAARVEAQKLAAGLTEQTELLRQQTAAMELQLRGLHAEADAVRDKRSEVAARAARLSSDLAYLEESCLQELGVTADELRADDSFARLDAETLAVEDEACRALKQKMEAMGPVNMMALEEHKEAAQRHGFLETQRQDLLGSIENTQNSIREIETISQAKFEEAFARINENFSVTFSQLFGGGQAMMRLTDEENTTESGIDIIASPPGKKLQNVLLLSGGEKALTALALLMGIFQYQPSPFCLLDEVDSPLDEANVGRLSAMLRGQSDNTHFIVITHSKRMMQAADSIFGVTMQEPGVSKVVSVRLGGEHTKEQRVEQRELVSA